MLYKVYKVLDRKSSYAIIPVKVITVDNACGYNPEKDIDYTTTDFLDEKGSIAEFRDKENAINYCNQLNKKEKIRYHYIIAIDYNNNGNDKAFTISDDIEVYNGTPKDVIDKLIAKKHNLTFTIMGVKLDSN